MAGKPVRILLIEDNVADVYLFRKALQSADLNFELTVIDDGSRALAFIRGEGEYADTQLPDLAVLDVSLPKHDGIQVLDAIRETKRFANMPVVVTSSSPSPPAHFKAEHLQDSRYIMKPQNLDDFLQIGAVLKGILLQNQARSAGHGGR